MDVPYAYYESSQMKRKLGPDWHKQPGCQHQPLFNIPLDQIIIDELHLMLRVMDRLETGLILEVIDWDEVDNMHTNTSTHIHRIMCKYKKNFRELMLKIEFCIFYILHIKIMSKPSLGCKTTQ